MEISEGGPDRTFLSNPQNTANVFRKKVREEAELKVTPNPYSFCSFFAKIFHYLTISFLRFNSLF